MIIDLKYDNFGIEDKINLRITININLSLILELF